MLSAELWVTMMTEQRGIASGRRLQETRIIIVTSSQQRKVALVRARSSVGNRNNLQIITTSLPGVVIVKPRVFKDQRGFFVETYRENALAEAGIQQHFVQDNHSRSSRGVLRGLHYQLRHPQAKFCRVVQGEVLDIAVDIRLGSPTFGKWVSVLLSGENHLQLFIPVGFAHGFVVRSESADFLYKCSDYYDGADDRGVLWNDPDIGIDWQTPLPILSEKDCRYLPLSRVSRDHLPQFQS